MTSKRNQSSSRNPSRRTVGWCLVTTMILLLPSSQSFLVMSAASAAPNKKLVVVTGGSRGIGKATCLHLASKGYQVAVNYCSGEEAAQQVVQEIEANGGTAKAFGCDIADEDAVKQMFASIKSEFGMAPTGLVNNAGIMEAMEKDILKISSETLERDLRVNTMGTFFCTREFVQYASTSNNGQGGAIVVVSSVSAESAQILAYGMSKAALEAMVNGLSKTLPLEGIRINTVVPGLIDTGLASPDIIDRMKGFIPLRRAGEPTEVAQAIEYLLSDESAYCSGTKLRIAGGL